MGKLGRRGIFSTGASLGGGSGISTPSDNAFRVRFENEQELSADLKIVRKLGISFENEMELQSEILKFKSLGIQFENEDDLVSELASGAFAFGNALEFDGVNDYVSLMGANAIKTAQPFSISFWVNPTDLQARLAQFSTNTTRGFFIGLSTDANYKDLYFSCQDGALTDVNHSFVIGQWYHIVITYNGLGFTTRSNYKCYIDSVSKTLNASGSFSSAANEVQIGGQFGDGLGVKTMDEWYYWDNYELTPTDVSNLYNGGFGDYASVVAGTPTFELRFNESGSDTTAADSSGNGNNGTLNNFALPGAWVAH